MHNLVVATDDLSVHLPLIAVSGQQLVHGIFSVLPSSHDKLFIYVDRRQHIVIVDPSHPCIRPLNGLSPLTLCQELSCFSLSHLSEAPNFEPLPNHSPISSSLPLSPLLFPQSTLHLLGRPSGKFRDNQIKSY